MKKHTLNLLAVSLLLASASITQAQMSTTNPLFMDNNAYFSKLENAANEIISQKGFLTPEAAQQQLMNTVDKKVDIKSKKIYKRLLSAEKIAILAKESTLIVGDAYLCGSCSNTHVNAASGYTIDESGIVVTNHHVMAAYAEGKVKKLSLQVMTVDGRVYPVTEILSCSKERDLAIIKVDTKGDKLKALPLGHDAPLGSDVYVMSNPNRMLFYFSKGIVARNYLKKSDNGDTASFPEMEITADYAAGSSGAPVLDNKGNLVGTVSTTSSIYYHPNEQKDLQMVVKGTKPVILLKELLNFK